MPVITLTTEWRPDDIYTGILKGRICSLAPGANIIDNASALPAFNIPHASFVVRNTFSFYPQGSIHIICVGSEASKETKYLAVKAKGHYFIGTDNGIFNLILNSGPDEAVVLGKEEKKSELDIFAETAAEIFAGKELSQIGSPIVNIVEKVPLRATIDKNLILGSVIFIDSYGNAFTNITKDIFLRVFDQKPYRIIIQSNRNFISSIKEKYCDVPDGELLARFNYLNLIEIAINGANISELFNLEVGSSVRIEIADETIRKNGLF